MRLLVFGATGQIGRALVRMAGPDLAVEPVDRRRADLTDPDACAAAVAASDADAVVNAAAYTAVDRAEAEEALSERINAAAPAAMAQAAARKGVPFLHLSTDYVFDGRGDRPWRETDAPAPLNAYGRGKLAGERAVAAAGGPHVVLRTSWVHAGEGGDFPSAILRRAAAGEALRVVDDQHGGPTPAAAAAAALATVARAFVEGRGTSGVFHFSGAPITTWRRFAEALVDAAGLGSATAITPVATADWPTPAARPRNGALDCAAIAARYGIVQPDWRAALPATVAAWRRL